MSQLNARIIDTTQETLDQFQSQLEPVLDHFHEDYFDNAIKLEDAASLLEDYFYACVEAYRMTHDQEYLKRASVLTKPLNYVAKHEHKLIHPERIEHLMHNYSIVKNHHFESTQGITTAFKVLHYQDYEFPEIKQVQLWLQRLDEQIDVQGDIWSTLIPLTHYFYATIEAFQHDQKEEVLQERCFPLSKKLYKCYLSAIGDRLRHRYFDQIPVPGEHELLLGRLWRDYHFVRDCNYDAINQVQCPPPLSENNKANKM